jgi:uncharacterized protein with PQ loop repeat
MKTFDLLHLLTYFAAVLLCLGYWMQVYKIHKHKEVRDLNIWSYVVFAVAYVILGFEAYSIDSTVFLVKNALVLVPTCILIWQIRVHKDDKWVDDYSSLKEKQECPKVTHMHKRINIKNKKA